MAAPEALTPLAQAVGRLSEAGVDTPNLDATLLYCKVLGCTRTELIAHPGRRPNPSQAAEFEALVARREAREPLPHLLGEWEFMGHAYEVGPQALIPRPETEVLVEAVVERLRRGRGAGSEARKTLHILEVGTGTGCIAIELALRLSGVRVTSVDLSPEALNLARRNVARCGLEDRVDLRLARFPQDTHPLGLFDAIISNPPYIPSAEVDRLEPELTHYEPRTALDGGPDGLSVIRALIFESARCLKPGGLLAMEIGHDQAETVTELLRASGRTQIHTLPDLAGHVRVVLAHRLPTA